MVETGAPSPLAVAPSRPEKPGREPVAPESVAACLIVQDEQARLPAALDSVAFCDEVIVVDGGSSDDTVEIARRAGATVIENSWPGYGAQRNVAIDAATSDWILEVDADERVTPALRASVQALLASPPPDVAMAVCALRNRLLGGTLGPSAKYPAYRSRLFRPEAYRHDESRAVHEGIGLRESPLILEGDLEHELADTLHEALLDMWRYAQLESHHVASPATSRAYVTGMVLRPMMKFLYRTFVDGGWRDGWRGLLKISLDVSSDALVWLLVLLRRDEGPSDHVGAGGAEHFGQRSEGPVRIVALAAEGHSTSMAADWLSALQAGGADVVLISEDRTPDRDIPSQTVSRIGPLAIIRALEIQRQVRIFDAVVPFGRRARLVQRLLPGTFKPEIPGLSSDLHPDRALELLRTRFPDDGPGRSQGA
jgi:hypothetical protein